MKNERIKALDGLKGIGCCLVAFFWHYQHFGNYIPPLNKILFPLYRGGNYAVELFFILSGFTMEMHYSDAIRDNTISFKVFFKNRYMSLWPMQLLTLLVVTALEFVYRSVYGELFVVEHFDVYHFILNVFMVQSGWIENSYSFNTPAWFVSTLLLTYIVFYLINRSFKDKSVYIYLLLVVVSIVARSYGVTIPFLHAAFAARAYMYFFCGAILYSLYERDRMFAVPSAGLVVCACSAVTKLLWNIGSVMLPFLGLIFFPMVVILAVRSKMVERVLSLSILRKLGSISMEVFFWHFPVQIAIVLLAGIAHISIDYSSVCFLLFYILITIFVAVLMSRLRRGHKTHGMIVK